MENELNYQELYNQAQQEIVNLQHTVRVLVSRLQAAESKQAEAVVVEEPKKKAN
jgi:uncharacterized coiled-coil protein SlyX